MLLAAQPGGAVAKNGDTVNEQETLYGGWDRINRPYGQLTDLGSQQLVFVGKKLRERYSTLLTGTAKNDIYCRSTNTCRTGQSIRSLLVGLLDVNPDEHDSNITVSSLQNLPHIHIHPYALENLYPQGGGPAMIQRRSQVYPPGLEERTLPGYATDVKRAQELYRFAEKANWVVVMEVLNCHNVHNIEHIKGVTPDDLETATRLATWHWGLLYKDSQLNRLAIGRFLWDLNGKDAATDTFLTEQAAATGKRMLIYSGHDSTLVPVLCALGIFDDKWPPYASHLTLEVAGSKTQPAELFVRAVYNDVETNVFGYADSPWCPLEVFWERLAQVAISPEEYSYESVRVRVSSAEETDAGTAEDIALTSKEMADDIAATITG
eukprot:gene24575-27792_t